jgi:multiple sugar transport system permease protein/putative aldouronate transport system permease protein
MVFTLVGEKKDGFNLFDILNILIVGLFAFLCIYPLYYILINSFSSPLAVGRGVFLAPVEFTLEAYKQLNSISGIGSSIFISVGRTVVGSLWTTFCSSFAAYILTRRHLPIRKILYRFFIVTMYINAGFIAHYLLISSLGLKNNFLVYILPYGMSAYYLILIKTYIENSMPASVWESAEIDGAGVAMIYGRIIVPLAQPILACIIIFAAVFQWNAWADDLYYMLGARARNLHCLQFLLYKNLQSTMSSAVRDNSVASGQMDVTPTTLRMAMTFVTVLPVLCVYPFMQRYFTKGIMLGSVKG